MLSIAVYKILHYLGVFTMLTALAATLARGEQAPNEADPWRKRLGIVHGVALFLILLGGFGMLAKLGLGFPGWAMAKVGIWIAFGGLVAARKRPSTAGWALVLLPVLAVIAGWLGYAKPF